MRSFTRTLLGAILSLILVGEVTVGMASGLYTPAGLVVFSLLYITFFMVMDSLVQSRNLNNLQITLLTFAFYAVLITGLLHGEIKDYSLRPDNSLITTLIRIQASLFMLFTFPIVNRLLPGRPVASPRKSFLVFMAVVLILTPAGKFGLFEVFRTAQTAPFLTAFFVTMAIIALVIALRKNPLPAKPYANRAFMLWAWLLLFLGLFPSLPIFFILLMLMLCVGIYYLRKASFRQASVNYTTPESQELSSSN